MDAQEVSVLRLAGQVNADRLLAGMNLSEDGSCRRRRWLIDFSGGKLDLSHDEIQGLVVHFNRRPPESRRGVRVAVVAGDELNFGVSRMLGAYVENLGIELRPFYGRREALDFLGVGQPSQMSS